MCITSCMIADAFTVVCAVSYRSVGDIEQYQTWPARGRGKLYFAIYLASFVTYPGVPTPHIRNIVSG